MLAFGRTLIYVVEIEIEIGMSRPVLNETAPGAFLLSQQLQTKAV